MAVETDRSWQAIDLKARLGGWTQRIGRLFGSIGFPSRFTTLTGRIVGVNLLGLAILIFGIISINQSTANLIDAQVKSLQAQGQIMATAIAASSATESSGFVIDANKLLEQDSETPMAVRVDGFSSLEFPINPERVAPILKRLVQPTGTRARIYARDGALVLDSARQYETGRVLQFELPRQLEYEASGFFDRQLRNIKAWLRRRDLLVYKEIGDANGKAYSEVVTALAGTITPIVRVNEIGELIVSVAVPIKQTRSVLGALLLSTREGEIDSILAAQHWSLAKVFFIATGVAVFLSVLLAGMIAGPMQKLSEGAKRVRKSIKAREEIPDFTHRSDEIGYLSGALRDMTEALYRRMDAIENFAADVSHELKNPLTSLRSAAETFPLAIKPGDRERLMEIILKDVKRLDRLITDISDASRLDAELVREDAQPVNLVLLIETIAAVFDDLHREGLPRIIVEIADVPNDSRAYIVNGHDSRIAQVIHNLLGNAMSFSPPNSSVRLMAHRIRNEVEIIVDDDGPGIPPENLERIFERFYTDRPGEESFGENSGLGLNISRQIVMAHDGRIWAENRYPAGTAPQSGGGADTRSIGARLIVRLPAA
ncbi:sensor histidine kinase ResE [bacterium MnTg02]|nr:sensor histidine kinase ResE [bacterium MnTg02]